MVVVHCWAIIGFNRRILPTHPLHCGTTAECISVNFLHTRLSQLFWHFPKSVMRRHTLVFARPQRFDVANGFSACVKNMSHMAHGMVDIRAFVHNDSAEPSSELRRSIRLDSLRFATFFFYLLARTQIKHVENGDSERSFA